MSVTRHVTFCRICNASCGLVVDVEDDRVTSVRPDPDNPLSRGFTCPKGRRWGDLHQGTGRLLSSKKRSPDGGHKDIATAVALREVAEQLTAIVDRHGPGAVAMFTGTQTYFATLTYPFSRAWLAALASPKLFSTMTIDQSAKWVAPMRMGSWHAGPYPFTEADVCLLVGTNPLVSLQATTGFPTSDPIVRLRQAKRRGMALIVIDPRRTETAQHADVHLQPLPGHDPLVLSGLLNVIFDEGLEDAPFCAEFTDQVDDLRAAVSDATPAAVAARTGIPAEELVRAARTFAGRRRGLVAGGTGPDMGPWSNLAEHLIACLSAVCGFYPRAGAPVPNPGVLQRRPPARAEVVPASREWEGGFHSRIGGYGTLHGELPSAILAEEILQPGPDQIRALVVSGGNPAVALPDQARAVEALSSLELLVTIDPRMSETARLAHYVLAPVLGLERPDVTHFELTFAEPFAQYTDAVLPWPGDLLEDWELYWGLAAEMGLQLKLGPMDFDMAAKPTSAELLALVSSLGVVPLDEVKTHPHGRVFDVPAQFVEPAESNVGDRRLQLLPPDVGDELRAALTAPPLSGHDCATHLLTVRRMKEVMNSVGRDVDGLPRYPYNPAYLNPTDLESLGLHGGELVQVASTHASVQAVVQPDPSVRTGVVSMTHCWGGLPEDGGPGCSTSRLVSTTEVVETINAMPRMTAIPVCVTPIQST